VQVYILIHVRFTENEPFFFYFSLKCSSFLDREFQMYMKSPIILITNYIFKEISPRFLSTDHDSLSTQFFCVICLFLKKE
jgi:hypothetical protein